MYDKIFSDMSGVKFDYRTQDYDLIFPNLEEALKHKEKFKDISKAPSAQFGDYVSIRLDGNHRIIIKKADNASVRKEFLDDNTKYNILASFKNAEFHGYVHFTNLDSKVNKAIGVSVGIPGSKTGSWIIRSDDAYNSKYFKGTLTQASPKPQKGSFAVEILITEQQLLDIIDKINQYAQSIPCDNQDFFYLSNNCHHFSNKIYKELGLGGHYIDFIRSKHLDFNDMGVFYKYILANTSKDLDLRVNPFSIAWKLVSDSDNKVMLKNLDIPIRMIATQPESYLPSFIFNIINVAKSIKWNFYYYFSSNTLEAANEQDEGGNNALHKALLMKDIKSANEYLDMGVSSTASNNRGETPLHLAAGLSPSVEKIALLGKILEKSNSKCINQPDLYADNIPLTFAIMADDSESIKFLIEHGADINFINGTKESLGNIAVENGKLKAVSMLHSLSPKIFYHDNGTRQIPIHHHKIKDLSLPIDEAPLPKDQIAEHNIILDVHNYFQPLVTPSTSCDSLESS